MNSAINPLTRPAVRSAVQSASASWSSYSPRQEPLTLWLPASGMRNASDEAAEYRDALATLPDASGNGYDAAQATGGLRPECLPLIGGDGYLYLSGVAGNGLTVSTPPTLDFSNDFNISIAMRRSGNNQEGLFSDSPSQRFILLRTNGNVDFRMGGVTVGVEAAAWSAASTASDTSHEYSWDSAAKEMELSVNAQSEGSVPVSNPVNFDLVYLGQIAGNTFPFSGALLEFILDGEFVLKFSKLDHLANSFIAITGQPITVNTSGTNPAAIIGQPVTRFDSSHELAGTAGADLETYKAVTVYQDLTTGIRGVRVGTVADSAILSTSGSNFTLGGVAMFYEDCLIVPPATDTTRLAKWASRKYGAEIL